MCLLTKVSHFEYYCIFYIFSNTKCCLISAMQKRYCLCILYFPRCMFLQNASKVCSVHALKSEVLFDVFLCEITVIFLSVQFSFLSHLRLTNVVLSRALYAVTISNTIPFDPTHLFIGNLSELASIKNSLVSMQ